MSEIFICPDCGYEAGNPEMGEHMEQHVLQQRGPERPDEVAFSVRVNGGEKVELALPTGVYISAAAAVPALLGRDDYPMFIEIWVDQVTHDYGPYIYRIDFPGAPVLMLTVASTSEAAAIASLR